MKRSILFLLTGIVSLQSSLMASNEPIKGAVISQPQEDRELAWVDEQIQAILPSRIGIPDGFINSLRDPMKMKKAVSVTVITGNKLLAPPKLGVPLVPVQPKIVEEPLRLLAIMNKSVLINGKWYKVGQNVRSFTVGEIRSNSVLLNGAKDQKLILFLNKQNNNIKIITK